MTWGDGTRGGNSSAVASQLSSGVQSLASPFDEELYAPSGGGGGGGGAQLVLSAAEAITLGGAQRASLGLAAVTQPTGALEGAGAASAAQATDLLLRTDAALQTVTAERARAGAVLNRLEALIGNLSTAGNNLTAARSRITDADVAAETAALTRAQILQQAGQAMLAQANITPRLVLALLRDGR
ncbi:MAG: flagellin [Planctomycetota bacterium]